MNSSREPGNAGRTETWRDSLPIDMLLSAVRVLVVAQSSSEIPEGFMNNPVYSQRVLLYVRSFEWPCVRKTRCDRQASVDAC